MNFVLPSSIPIILSLLLTLFFEQITNLGRPEPNYNADINYHLRIGSHNLHVPLPSFYFSPVASYCSVSSPPLYLRICSTTTVVTEVPFNDLNANSSHAKMAPPMFWFSQGPMKNMFQPGKIVQFSQSRWMIEKTIRGYDHQTDEGKARADVPSYAATSGSKWYAMTLTTRRLLML